MKTQLPLTLATIVSTLFIASATLRASDMDDRIESSAAKSYVFKTYLKDDRIKTEAKNGVVTLTGTVAVDAHKSLAEDTVASLPGVNHVDNQLTVTGDQPAEHSDRWISLKVKTALLFHRYVSATGTTVSVKDGIVTLQGEATSLAQKELTAEYAKDVDNVISVKNDMTVAGSSATDKTADKAKTSAGSASEKIDDASITAQVKAALFSHHSTSALHTGVATADGVVTLTGVAKNDAEKSLVSKLANDVTGVTDVINKMTVTVPVTTN